MLTARKGEIDSNTIIWGYFNTPLTSMNRSSRQKIIKETGLKWHIRPDGFYILLLFSYFHPKETE